MGFLANSITNHKDLLAILAITLTFIAFIPYVKSILLNQTKPHIFSWVIWGITTMIVCFAQLADGGGAGAWPIGVSGVTTICIAILAYYKHSDSSITRIDWIFFISALSAIPFWYITNNPLSAVLILTIIDLVGFAPTIRKAYVKPFEEQILLYSIMVVRNFIAVLALENYSLTTLLFPVAIAIGCLVLITVITIRRKRI